MTNRLQYLANGHLLAVTFLSGFVVGDAIRFFNLFFDSNALDAGLFIILFAASIFVSAKYYNLNKLQFFYVQISFLILVILNSSIKDAILLHPEVLNILIYAAILLAGSSCAMAGKTILFQYRHLNFWYSIFCVVLGAYFGYSFIPAFWIKATILIAAIFLFFLTVNLSALVRTVCFACLSLVFGYSVIANSPIDTFASQKKFHDRVIFSAETPFQKIDITSWKGNQWFYFNNINQLSTLDEWMYYEALVHPAMHLTTTHSKVLVIGGEKGMITRELIKYEQIEKIRLLPLDTGLLNIGKGHPLFTNLNENSLANQKVEIIYTEPFRHLMHLKEYYDVIIVDVPDPMDIEINQYYTREFYELCSQGLSAHGVMITQAGSPYYATKAFQAVSKSMRSGGFYTLPLHNQIITMGEWGWVIGSKNLDETAMKEKCSNLKFDAIDTKWLNNESMKMMMSFGKSYVIADSIETNSIKNPVIYEYYRSGTWNFE